MNKVLPRACVYAYDALALFAVAVVLSFAFITPAYAYVDPSVMTYAIQAVAGVILASALYAVLSKVPQIKKAAA